MIIMDLIIALLCVEVHSHLIFIARDCSGDLKQMSRSNLIKPVVQDARPNLETQRRGFGCIQAGFTPSRGAGRVERHATLVRPRDLGAKLGICG